MFTESIVKICTLCFRQIVRSSKYFDERMQTEMLLTNEFILREKLMK